MSKKLLKGKQVDDISKAKVEMEKNLVEQEDGNMEEEYEEDENGGNMPVFTSELARLKEKELGQNEADENMNDDIPSDYSDSSEDKEDYFIRKTDSLIVAATAENDHSNLEVYVYDHKTSDLYVHHEIILSSYPLCIEWLSNW